LGVRATLTGVPHHLKILRQAGLVSARREGRRAIYVTTDDPVVGLAVSAFIISLWRVMFVCTTG
jgi:DNA-binding transcriptional ArsR family regulator